MLTFLTILLLLSQSLFPSAGKASYYDDGPGFYAAVHSYTWGDPRYPVDVCRQDDPNVCVLVVVRDHMESLDKAIDLGPDAFVALWPQYNAFDPAEYAMALDRGVVHVTITRSNLDTKPLPPTDTEPCTVTPS